MNTLLALLTLAAQTNGQELPRPDRPPKPLKAGAPEVTTRAGVEVSYDDNFLELSEKQIDQLDSGTRPEKFKIEEPEDLIYSPWVELKLKAWLLAEPTSFGLKMQPHYYQESSIANYEEYEAFVAQNLGPHEAGLEVELDRDVYHRELEIVVPGPNLWESAFYSQYEGRLYYEHRVAEGLSARGFGGYRQRNFESPFDFRDLDGYFAGGRATLEFGKPVSVFAQYEHASMESAAEPADPDTSYRQHEIEIGGEVALFGKHLVLTVRQRWALREYTTSNDPALDPDHVDREDVRRRTLVAAQLNAGKAWSVELTYIRREEDSDRPFNTGDTAEAVGSTRDVFTLGMTVSF